MSQSNEPTNPIVEILISAYRRGLAIQQNSQPAKQDTPSDNAKPPRHKGGFTKTATSDNCRSVPVKDDQHASTDK